MIFEKSCENCGRMFSGKRSDAKYCCNLCGNRARNKRHYSKNPEQYAIKRRQERKDRPKMILSRIKYRSKKLGLPFDLTKEDIVIPETCPVLNIKLVMDNSGQGYHTNSPSVDRIDPSKGYVKGNVRVISARANLLKSDATIEELEKVLEDMRRLEESS